MSSGSKLGAVASVILIVAFFLPWVRACQSFDLSGYDLARNKTGAVENPGVYWLSLIAPVFCLMLFFLVRTPTAANRIGAAVARLVAGLIGFVPLIVAWSNARQKFGAEIIEIRYGGWLTVLGYIGIILSSFVDFSSSPEVEQPPPVTSTPSEEPATTVDAAQQRTAAGLCPKCGKPVSPSDQNCPFCHINLAWARQNPDQLTR